MSNITNLNPYLYFNGNCREAMEFYQSCLGGSLDIMPFEGSPMQVAPEHAQKVMHATLKMDNATIMASDGMDDTQVTPGTNFSVSIETSTPEEGKMLYNKLAEGGTPTMPYEKQFWDDHFGMLKDKYGIHWMVSARD